MGDILVNNKERDLRKFRKTSCYIMQDDHLLPNLSVYESMMCSANLKLTESLSQDKKRAIVRTTLTLSFSLCMGFCVICSDNIVYSKFVCFCVNKYNRKS